MIKEYLDKRKRAKEEKAAKFEEERQRLLSEAETSLVIHVELMLKKPCPFNAGGNCKRECIHFDEGNSYAFYNGYVDCWISGINEPNCKLWK